MAKKIKAKKTVKRVLKKVTKKEDCWQDNDDFIKELRAEALKDDKMENVLLNYPKSNKIVLNIDPYKVYDYQGLFSSAVCPTCNQKLTWMFKIANSEEDKFCSAECCGLRHSMVPEKVRILSVPLAIFNSGVCPSVSDLSDEDFLNELREFDNQQKIANNKI